MSKYPSDIDVGEKEVTKPSEPGEKEMAPQRLRQSEGIIKPNPKYTNTNIIEDDVKEPETYEEAPHNTTWQQTMKEDIIALEQNQTLELVP